MGLRSFTDFLEYAWIAENGTFLRESRAAFNRKVG